MFLFSLFFLIPGTFGAFCRTAEYLDPSGKYCYVINNKLTTFGDAESSCYQYGGYKLAKVMSMADNQFMFKLTQRTGNAFIGATDITTDGTWQWIDGTPMTFVNWAPTFKFGSCAVMRDTDGQWLRGDCDEKLPSICYGPAIGVQTDAPTTPKTTTKPMFHRGQFIFFAGDTDFLGTPNKKPQTSQMYRMERDLIMQVADNAFTNNVNGDSVCDVWADFGFYGWAPIQQGFSTGTVQKQNSFDLSIYNLDFSNGNNYQMNNISTAITQLSRFHWYPQPQELGYTVLVFFTGQKDFTNVPSLFDPFPNVDEILVVLMNGSTMKVPTNDARVRKVTISNQFNSADVKIVTDALKCNS